MINLKKGDILTINGDYFDNSGNIIFSKKQKVKINEVIIKKGYYSTLCPYIWYDDKITGIKIRDIEGVWSLKTFVETEKI